MFVHPFGYRSALFCPVCCIITVQCGHFAGWTFPPHLIMWPSKNRRKISGGYTHQIYSYENLNGFIYVLIILEYSLAISPGSDRNLIRMILFRVALYLPDPASGIVSFLYPWDYRRTPAQDWCTDQRKPVSQQRGYSAPHGTCRCGITWWLMYNWQQTNWQMLSGD